MRKVDDVMGGGYEQGILYEPRSKKGAQAELQLMTKVEGELHKRFREFGLKIVVKHTLYV
jgi:hypothetical protein